jgi:hypothetical protein
VNDLRDTLREGIVLADPMSAVDYLLVTTTEEGYPRTWRHHVDGGRAEVAVDAALDLLPHPDAKTGWATDMVELLGAVDRATEVVAAVRGLGDLDVLTTDVGDTG